MSRTIEVFADITCPFTHVGLRRVVAQLDEAGADIEIVVRAWPLEWVNGEMFSADAIAAKIAVLRDQLGIDDFAGFDPSTWPTTCVPALNLCAAAAERGRDDGLAMALEVRAALFERGADISDPTVLSGLAAAHGLAPPASDAVGAVLADYQEGQRRGVRGSPDFWIGESEFFCPALEITHDADGGLVAHFDPTGLEAFIAAALD